MLYFVNGIALFIVLKFFLFYSCYHFKIISVQSIEKSHHLADVCFELKLYFFINVDWQLTIGKIFDRILYSFDYN